MTERRAVANLLTADRVLRVGALHPFDGTQDVYRSVALRDGAIVAVGEQPDACDDLVGPHTFTADLGDCTVLPAFFDTHNHMLRAGPDAAALQLRHAGGIEELVAAIRHTAGAVPAGQWIVPSRSWHESNLAERRLPTAAELDRATDRHPIALRRGGHVLVANTMALRRAGIDASTPDPPGGTIVRDGDGRPTGVLIERAAFAAISAQLPTPAFQDQLASLRQICLAYSARGIGAIRDPGVQDDEFLVYQTARERHELTVRSTVMLRLLPEWDVQRMVAEIERWSVRTGFGDDMLRLGGVKVFMDGGVEGGALREPYASDPGYRGHVFLSVDDLATVVDAAVARGWQVGCHAVGEVALDMVLDAYERVRRSRPGLRPGHLVVEHALFADERQRRRAVDLGVGVTVQHPLLYALGANMVAYWGEDRTERVAPIRGWVDDGALVAAGTDHNVTFYDPLLALWGMITRGTARAGRRGVDQAVDRRTAFALSTVAGARLIGEEARRGSLVPGHLADLVAFPVDPLTCPVDDLPELQPVATLVGGAATYDPQQRFGGKEVAGG